MLSRVQSYFPAFLDELEKIGEYAPGIPSKTRSHELPVVKKPEPWEFGVHEHDADKRGKHFDLRLGDPATGRAHSWAMHAQWPKPGEKTWAIQQPTHTVKYMDFKGTIADGYGKGKVELFDRAKTEVMAAKPGHINFNVYRPGGPEEYTLHKVGPVQWVLMNRTMTRDQHPHLPESKPKYKETELDNKKLLDDKYLLSAKIDDAHNLFYFPTGGDKIRAMSYRKGKKGHGLIEHTHKVSTLQEGVSVPAGLGGTILRGGLYAMNPKTGKATTAATLAGMLNTDVWKSREKQETHGDIVPVLYDVVQYRGRKMEDAPYAEKLEVLKKVQKALPDVFHLPRMARTPEEKQKLIADMAFGKIPETKEGVVAWNLHEGEKAIKAKFSKDHDVYIRHFFPGEGKYGGNGVGGFSYSHTPDGPIVGKVGTGLSDAQRRDMHKDPKKYLGLVARVTAQEKNPSGALRNPAFQGWHLDKNDPQDLAAVTH